MAGTVAVACKMPNGCILDLDRYEKTNDKGDVRLVRGSKRVTLKGWARRAEQPITTIGGYAITAVDADFWEEWSKTHADFGPLVDGLIFAMPTFERAKSRALEQEKEPAMYAPADPKADRTVSTASDDRGNPIIASNSAVA